MSQHIKSNTDFSNHSNNNLFDDDIGGIMTDLSHQESNATDRSSESASALLPNGGSITFMGGLNHLQSSPLQGFVNPNIGADILQIPSKVEVPQITPNGDEKQNNYNSYIKKPISDRNKPPDVQLPIDDDNKGIHPIPITPTDLSYHSNLSPLPPQLSNESPLPQQHNKDISDFSATDVSQIAAMSRYLPQILTAFQDLSSNVSVMQHQLTKMANYKPQTNTHSSHSSQTRYRSHSHSQSNSSVNSLRTQTSIASSTTYNNTLNSLNAYGVIYSNITNESIVAPTHSQLKRRSIPGAKNEKASSRRNRRSSPSNTRNRKTNHLSLKRGQHSVYNSYSQYGASRRKSIGPGAKPTLSPKSSLQFAYSPKGSRKYPLTSDTFVDSLELLNISQRKKAERLEENKNEEQNERRRNRRRRNRSQTLFMSSKEKHNQRQKRRTISEVNNNKMEDEAFSDEDEDFLDDEVSLYSDKVYALDSQTPTQPHGLAIIHSESNQSNHNDILFEEVEGNGKDEKISNKFHRKKNKNSFNLKDRKPSSSNASSTTLRSNSELSISSIAITDTDNEHTVLSRSVPHSPEPINEEMSTTKQYTKGGTFATRHLFPTPHRPNTFPTKIPTLIQSQSAHNIYAIKATAPQRPNTPKKEEKNPTTPRNTPNTTSVDPSSIISPPMNAYDINYTVTDNKSNRRRTSLTPPQEDKEQDDEHITHIALDRQSDDGIVIVDDEEMIINVDKVQEVQVYNGTYNTTDTIRVNTVEEAAHILFTNTSFTEQELQNGEDSVSLSINSSRPPSTKLNKNVHFDMNSIHSIKNEYSMDDIEENKVSADEQVKNDGKTAKNKGIKTKRGNDKILKIKNQIANHHLNARKIGNLRKLRLSQQNLKAHNLKNELMDLKVDQRRIRAMTNDQLKEMLININRIQWLIFDEQTRRECCQKCGIPTASSAFLLPCKHLIDQNVCYNCANSDLKRCPISDCHQAVKQIVFPKH